MEIRLSNTVELVKIIKAHRNSKENKTKISVGLSAIMMNIPVMHRHIIDLDSEDLDYLYNKYKLKAEETLDGVKSYMDDLKKQL